MKSRQYEVRAAIIRQEQKKNTPFETRRESPVLPAVCLLRRIKQRIIYAMKSNSLPVHMRNSAELVNEMLAEAKTAFLVAIVVGFEQETKFVFSTQKQPLGDLNRLIQKGGFPLGLLRFDREVAAVQGSYRPFDEYAGQEWVNTYLAGLLDNTQEIVSMGLQQNLPPAY